MFCDIFESIPIIIALPLFCIISGVLLFVFLSICPPFGLIWGIGLAVFYLKATITEFAEGDVLHGLIAILLLIPIIVFWKQPSTIPRTDISSKENETQKIPSRVNDYIRKNGFTSVHKFVTYFEQAPEYLSTRGLRYDNPLYAKQVEANKRLKANKLPPMKITEPPRIGYARYASFRYKEEALSRLNQILPDVIRSMYMFDYDDLYNALPGFKDFFVNENGEYGGVEKFCFVHETCPAINTALSAGIIERVGSDTTLYRSKIIPESEGNVEIGETIELSLDD